MTEKLLEKINFNGIYRCEPSEKYCKGNLHWCKNWTFRPVKYNDGRIVMIDTYWLSSSDGLCITLTEDNIDDFELIFDNTKVKQIKESEVKDYEHYYRVATDSGGWSYAKYFVDTDKKKSITRVIEKIDNEITDLERKIKWLKEDRELIIRENEVPKWY